MEILLEENEFLSDKLLETKINKTFIWAPTGTGKTTLFAKIAERDKAFGKSTLFVTTSNAIQDAFTEKLHCEFNKINAKTKNKLQFVKGEIAIINLQHFEFIEKETRKKYTKKILEHFDNIFVDEFHLIFTKDAYLEIATILSQKATFCTGTKIARMNSFLGENNISPILVMKPGSSHVNVHKCYVSGYSSAINILNSIKLDKPTLVQVRTVKEALITSGWLFTKGIKHNLCIARDRVQNITTATEAINNLRNKEIDVIVATKGIMGEALDIKNIENSICINTTDFLEDSIQLVGRFRDAKTVDLYAKWDDNRWSEQYFVENIVKSHSFNIENHSYKNVIINNDKLVRTAYENNSALIAHYKNLITKLLVDDEEAIKQWNSNNCFLDVTDITEEDIEKLLDLLEIESMTKINNRKWKIDLSLIQTKEIDGVSVCSSEEEIEITLRRELLKKFFRMNGNYLEAKWFDYNDEIKKNNSLKYHYTNKWLNIDLLVNGCELDFKTELERTLLKIKEDCKLLGLGQAEIKNRFDRCNKLLESIKNKKFNYRQYKEI